MEAEAAMEQQQCVVAGVHLHLAGQPRHARFGETLHVGVENPAQSGAAVRPSDHDAIDVKKLCVTLAKPEKIRTVVVRFRRERDQETGQMAICLGTHCFGDPEIGGMLPEESQPVGIHGQDGVAGGVVER